MKASTLAKKIRKSDIGLHGKDGKVVAKFDLVRFAYRGVREEIKTVEVKEVKLSRGNIIMILGGEVK